VNGILLVAAAALAVDYGWQTNPAGEVEYIIQVEPELLDSLRSGQQLVSEIPPELQNVRRVIVRVGRGALAHPLPARTAPGLTAPGLSAPGLRPSPQPNNWTGGTPTPATPPGGFSPRGAPGSFLGNNNGNAAGGVAGSFLGGAIAPRAGTGFNNQPPTTGFNTPRGAPLGATGRPLPPPPDEVTDAAGQQFTPNPQPTFTTPGSPAPRTPGFSAPNLLNPQTRTPTIRQPQLNPPLRSPATPSPQPTLPRSPAPTAVVTNPAAEAPFNPVDPNGRRPFSVTSGQFNPSTPTVVVTNPGAGNPRTTNPGVTFGQPPTGGFSTGSLTSIPDIGRTRGDDGIITSPHVNPVTNGELDNMVADAQPSLNRSEARKLETIAEAKHRWTMNALTVLLFASIALNLYLVWIARSAYRRYRTLTSEFRQALAA